MAEIPDHFMPVILDEELGDPSRGVPGRAQVGYLIETPGAFVVLDTRAEISRVVDGEVKAIYAETSTGQVWRCQYEPREKADKLSVAGSESLTHIPHDRHVAEGFAVGVRAPYMDGPVVRIAIELAEPPSAWPTIDDARTATDGRYCDLAARDRLGRAFGKRRDAIGGVPMVDLGVDDDGNHVYGEDLQLLDRPDIYSTTQGIGLHGEFPVAYVRTTRISPGGRPQHDWYAINASRASFLPVWIGGKLDFSDCDDAVVDKIYAVIDPERPHNREPMGQRPIVPAAIPDAAVSALNEQLAQSRGRTR